MKPSTLVLIGSLAANVGLIGFFAFNPERSPGIFRDYFSRAGSPQSQNSTASSKIGTTAPSAETIWSQIHSTDLRQFADRLRAAGFPPELVRALVGAEIDNRINAQLVPFASAIDTVTYWKPPNATFGNDPARTYAMLRIRAQRDPLLHEILGDDPPGERSIDDLRQFGGLASSKVDLIKAINTDYYEMMNQLRAAGRGRGGPPAPPDPEKTAVLDRERHADLVAILTPEELANYEMKNSPAFPRVTEPLAMMNGTEEEFRTLYAILSPLSDQLNSPSTRASLQQREELFQTINSRIRDALGEQRYADYARASNSEYQALYQLAEKENIPAASTMQAFDLRDASAQESMRIFSDGTLSTDQKHAALQKLAQDSRAQLMTALGPKVGEKYTNSHGWLYAIEHDNAVTFSSDGQGGYTAHPIVPRGAQRP